MLFRDVIMERGKMKTVIMAGGRGTRIADYSKELTGKVLPKPMIPIDGVPVLEWEIYSILSR